MTTVPAPGLAPPSHRRDGDRLDDNLGTTEVVDLATYRRDLEARRLLTWARRRVSTTYPRGWQPWEYEVCARRFVGIEDPNAKASRR